MTRGKDHKSHAYAFEAKGIQRYILDSGRLADMIGGSDLIADLCQSSGDDLLADVLKSLNHEPGFSRRASGAFGAISDEPGRLEALRALWRLAVGLSRPGLEFVDCAPQGDVDDMAALRLTRSAMSGIRDNDQAMLLPAGHPFVEFNPRTGRVAIRHLAKKDDFADGINDAQKHRGDALARDAGNDRLARNFLPEDQDADLVFPRHFEEEDGANDANPAFPFPGRDRRIAVVHADISGLGEFYAKAGERRAEPDQLRELSSLIERAIISAVRKASVEHLCKHALTRETDARAFSRAIGRKDDDKNQARPLPEFGIVPARPVLLGGDDITLIIRADLALPFVEHLLNGIEAEARAEFQRANIDQPGLTACAGVLIVAPGYPTLAAAGMADEICSDAKKLAKQYRPYRSAMAFSVMSSSESDGFDAFHAREMVTADELRLPLTHPAYFIDGAEGGVGFRSLVGLAEALSRLPGTGKLIEAMATRFSGPEGANIRWDRFWAYAEREDAEQTKAVREALLRCTAPVDDDAPLPSLEDSLAFVSDALELIDIGAVPFLTEART